MLVKKRLREKRCSSYDSDDGRCLQGRQVKKKKKKEPVPLDTLHSRRLPGDMERA